MKKPKTLSIPGNETPAVRKDQCPLVRNRIDESVTPSKGNRANERSGRPAESQLSAQIAPKSYLGTALKGVRRSTRRSQRHPSNSPSSSETEGSSPMDDYSSSSSSGLSRSRGNSQRSESSGLEERHHNHKRQWDNQHGRNKRCQQSSSGSAYAGKIKPIPPKEYDGAADVRAYHRFVWERSEDEEKSSCCRTILLAKPTTFTLRK